MKREESPGTVYFDPDGDVRLLVEGPDGEVTLVVSSKALKLSCAPFKAMLSPYFSEGQPDSNKKIPLPDDNLKALSILLHIAHLQFNKVPSKLEFNELLELSIITDKYAATSLIAPWLPNWISQLERLIDVPGYEAWIWIAWEFGRQDIFVQIANRLVLKAIDGSERDGLLLKDQRTVSSEYLPPDMTEMIIHTRENTISQLCDVVQRYVDLYSDAPYAQPQPICKAQSAHRAECDAIILGSLIQKLKRRRLWPTMGDPSEITTSIEGFSQSLLSMDIMCYPERIFHDGRGKDAHAGCSITAALRSELKQVLAEIPSVLQPSHKRHLQAQQEKLNNSTITT